MHILMLGAGGTGGYFGAKIHAAGGNITFLVRPARAENLLARGLRVSSPLGDHHISPKVLTAPTGAANAAFDVIVLSCKAYDLEAALNSIAPAVGPQTLILPLLNGIAHLPLLDARFGQARVLGGIAHLAVTLDPSGEIRHLNKLQRLVIGARGNTASPHLAALSELLVRSGIDFSLSADIESDMWDKFVFLCTLAAATCTMRSSVGDILETHAGEGFIVGLLDECQAVAGKCGHIPNAEQLAQYRNHLTARGSPLTASMLRDIEHGGPTEAEHILGDMVSRGEAHGVETPLLKLAYSHLQAYELGRMRKPV